MRSGTAILTKFRMVGKTRTLLRDWWSVLLFSDSACVGLVSAGLSISWQAADERLAGGWQVDGRPDDFCRVFGETGKFGSESIQVTCILMEVGIRPIIFEPIHLVTELRSPYSLRGILFLLHQDNTRRLFCRVCSLHHRTTNTSHTWLPDRQPDRLHLPLTVFTTRIIH